MGIPVVESDVSYLKMVDITKSNFELKCDDIAKAIEKSAFIGMLELIKDHMFEYLGETAGEGDRRGRRPHSAEVRHCTHPDWPVCRVWHVHTGDILVQNLLHTRIFWCGN